MQEMMEMILEGKVTEVDAYLSTLPPDTASQTKADLLRSIDALMQTIS